MFGENTVLEPIASVATNKGGDQFSRGHYSYVVFGASREDYDVLGRLVENFTPQLLEIKYNIFFTSSSRLEISHHSTTWILYLEQGSYGILEGLFG